MMDCLARARCLIAWGMNSVDLCDPREQDDVDNPAEGRMTAVTQTTPWFMWLESVEEEED